KSERDQYPCTHHEGREWPAHGRIRVHQLRRWEHVPAAAPRHPRDAAPILRLPPKGVYDRPYASRLAARLNLFLRCLTALTAGWGGGGCLIQGASCAPPPCGPPVATTMYWFPLCMYVIGKPVCGPAGSLACQTFSPVFLSYAWKT